MDSSQADINACGVPAPSTVDSDAVDAHAPHVRGGTTLGGCL
ncbi:hypothetical protein [Rhodococcus sp. AW25M09]|nr:hypothetical protein [Rhodococcus sp. AW25M09]